MILKKESGIKEVPVEEEGVERVTRKILIGPEDGSNTIIMRLFKVFPDGHTPYHNHAHEHVVKVEKGKGIVVDENDQEMVVAQGQCLLIEGNQRHQFKNPFQEPFEFLCIILNPQIREKSDDSLNTTRDEDENQ